MKLMKTWREFIKGSEYAEEDQNILLEIFEDGHIVADRFDQVQIRLILSETL